MKLADVKKGKINIEKGEGRKNPKENHDEISL
jgi:hypothetical protein